MKKSSASYIVLPFAVDTYSFTYFYCSRNVCSCTPKLESVIAVDVTFAFTHNK